MTGTAITLNPNSLPMEEAMSMEWLIPNRLGGYSHSTILGLPANRYHALLASGCENLRRIVLLEGLREEIRLPEGTINLTDSCHSRLDSFEFSHKSVSYNYNFEGFSLVKRVNPVPDKNGVSVLYTLENKMQEPIEIRAGTLVNSREAGEHGGEGNDFRTRFFTDKILGVGSKMGYLALYSDKATCAENEGERHSSDGNLGYVPAYFKLSVPGTSAQDFMVSALAYETERDTAMALRDLSQAKERESRVLSSGMGSSIFSLLRVGETFLVDTGAKKSIVSYPLSGEDVREAMIALPGLTLINGRLEDAEAIFERFLNKACRKGVPSGFVEGEPLYESIDTTLWLIDRLHKYGREAGRERLKKILHTYWWDVKDTVKEHIGMEKDGLLMHNGGTWIPERSNAVEVQGLWYSSLRIMEEFSDMMEDTEIDFRGIYLAFEESFLDAFWAGGHLRDTMDDEELRPNQLIALTLEFTPLSETLQKKVLNSLEGLVTEYGVRTLAPGSESYAPRERFNGAAFPWLLGPYLKLLMRLSGSRLRAKGILENIFDKHTREAGIGTISEFFSGNELKPSGNLSHAPAVAEITRAYFEDVMGREPQPPSPGIRQQ